MKCTDIVASHLGQRNKQVWQVKANLIQVTGKVLDDLLHSLEQNWNKIHQLVCLQLLGFLLKRSRGSVVHQRAAIAEAFQGLATDWSGFGQLKQPLASFSQLKGERKWSTIYISKLFTERKNIRNNLLTTPPLNCLPLEPHENRTGSTARSTLRFPMQFAPPVSWQKIFGSCLATTPQSTQLPHQQ